MKISGVKGMNDILPGEVGRWQEMEAVAREVFALHGYREVRVPIVEQAQLFSRSVGEATDIVKKEMYVFEDKGEELLVLRPEGTAGTVRAFIEHGAYVEGPQKWFYMGPMFRRERPQKGRYRQFHQIGCEAFGIADPFLDAEQIALLDGYFGRLGVRAELKINSVGDRSCRPAYLADLTSYLSSHKGALCADCNDRIERNPLRVLDCKVEGCQPILEKAPRLIERLCPECAAQAGQSRSRSRGAASRTGWQLSTLQSRTRSGFRSMRSVQSAPSSARRPPRYARRSARYAGRQAASPTVLRRSWARTPRRPR